MKDLLYYIVSNLVRNKEALQIEEREDKGTFVLTIIADEDDYGKIIGKNGRVIQSVRTLMKIYAINNHIRLVVKVGKDNR
ncbi:MAG: KH domain-containing protein [Clostridia bacterium]|nr:KH domain-containing protein [Clostridia bacterium]